METDIRMLSDLGESLDPPTGEVPTRLRHRVLAAIQTPRLRHRPSTGTRLAWRLGTAGAVAATVMAVAAGAGLFVARGAHVTGNPPPATSTNSVPDAAQVLTLAARYTATEPDLAARPDQFAFVESVVAYRAFPLGSEVAASIAALGPQLTRRWLSVDGTHDGLTRSRPWPGNDGEWSNEVSPGCRNGRFAPTRDRPNHTEECTPDPAVRLDLPTDPDAMLAYLYRPDEYATGLPADQVAFERVAEVLRSSHHSPAIQAAAFQAAARISDTTVVQHATDVAGRSGTAVTRTDRGIRAELIFDSATYRYLGTNRAIVDAAAAGALNMNGWHLLAVAQEAILRVGIVNRAGDLP